jgi:predicted alpha/beta-hydrolase family hydrolase
VASAGTALFIGGKSMGGRIATQVAAADAQLPIDGLVLLGYPLHPPGRPDERRDKHLPAIGRPLLFVQGTRDPFGTPAELAPIIDALGANATLLPVDGGEHSFKIARKDAQADVYTRVQEAIVTWTRAIAAAKRRVGR